MYVDFSGYASPGASELISRQRQLMPPVPPKAVLPKEVDPLLKEGEEKKGTTARVPPAALPPLAQDVQAVRDRMEPVLPVLKQALDQTRMVRREARDLELSARTTPPAIETSLSRQTGVLSSAELSSRVLPPPVKGPVTLARSEELARGMAAVSADVIVGTPKSLEKIQAGSLQRPSAGAPAAARQDAIEAAAGSTSSPLPPTIPSVARVAMTPVTETPKRSDTYAPQAVPSRIAPMQAVSLEKPAALPVTQAGPENVIRPREMPPREVVSSPALPAPRREDPAQTSAMQGRTEQVLRGSIEISRPPALPSPPVALPTAAPEGARSLKTEMTRAEGKDIPMETLTRPSPRFAPVATVENDRRIDRTLLSKGSTLETKAEANRIPVPGEAPRAAEAVDRERQTKTVVAVPPPAETAPNPPAARESAQVPEIGRIEPSSAPQRKTAEPRDDTKAARQPVLEPVVVGPGVQTQPVDVEKGRTLSATVPPPASRPEPGVIPPLRVPGRQDAPKEPLPAENPLSRYQVPGTDRAMVPPPTPPPMGSATKATSFEPILTRLTAEIPAQAPDKEEPPRVSLPRGEFATAPTPVFVQEATPARVPAASFSPNKIPGLVASPNEGSIVASKSVGLSAAPETPGLRQAPEPLRSHTVEPPSEPVARPMTLALDQFNKIQPSPNAGDVAVIPKRNTIPLPASPSIPLPSHTPKDVREEGVRLDRREVFKEAQRQDVLHFAREAVIAWTPQLRPDRPLGSVTGSRMSLISANTTEREPVDKRQSLSHTVLTASARETAAFPPAQGLRTERVEIIQETGRENIARSVSIGHNIPTKPEKSPESGSADPSGLLWEGISLPLSVLDDNGTFPAVYAPNPSPVPMPSPEPLVTNLRSRFVRVPIVNVLDLVL